MANIFIKQLWKKVVQWYYYRDKPVYRIDISNAEGSRSFGKLFIKSKEEHGKETIYLESICDHYKCELFIESANDCVLVFNDKRLYTMFMLKYSECL